jgi:hypothetical protein
MGIRAENCPQPPQISGELLDRYTLLMAQLTYTLPMRRCRVPSFPPPS